MNRSASFLKVSMLLIGGALSLALWLILAVVVVNALFKAVQP
jgi:hypothetical protein